MSLQKKTSQQSKLPFLIFLTSELVFDHNTNFGIIYCTYMYFFAMICAYIKRSHHISVVFLLCTTYSFGGEDPQPSDGPVHVARHAQRGLREASQSQGRHEEIRLHPHDSGIRF